MMTTVFLQSIILPQSSLKKWEAYLSQYYITKNQTTNYLKFPKIYNASLSQIINQSIEAGIYELYACNKNHTEENIESHCHQLAIQSNALLRKISMKRLDLSSEDLEMFKLVSKKKYQQILQNKSSIDTPIC